MSFPLSRVQAELAREKIDAWLLYDFRGQNPTAGEALELAGRMLTRRWFYLVPARGEPTLIVHAIERDNMPPLPGRKVIYAGHESLGAALRGALSGLQRVAMEYCPLGAIPYLSRVDAGTVELVRSYGPEVVSSATLVQDLVARWDEAQLRSHVRAAQGIDAAKDAAFDYVKRAHQRGASPLETEVQTFLMERFREASLVTDHPPIVAVNAHAGNPHYEPSERTPTRIERGDILLVDLWAKERGPRAVYADITWMAYCGATPPDEARRVFDVVAGGRDVGVETLRRAHQEGRTLEGWMVDRAVRDSIAAAGYGERFLHRTGHSIGATHVHGDGANVDDFETHDTRPLVPGLAFSIEPGVYLDAFGVRSEIDVFMGPGGPEIHSPVQRDWVRE